MKKALYLLLAVWFISCKNDDKSVDGAKTPGGDGPTVSAPPPKNISFSVINTFPHDPTAFTEGLLFHNGDLYESTGQKGQSRISQVDLKTGQPIRSTKLEDQYFGEGIVVLNDTVYQLTYQEKVGFMYSLKDFRKLGEFKFASEEGWALTTNGKEIIASDGSSLLYFYAPGTFKLLRTMRVTESGSITLDVNELEYIDGFIYANIWKKDYIVKIDPATGYIVGKIDFSSLASQVRARNPNAEVLNGIAYNDKTGKLYITGKNWPVLYEVELSK
jgi:glutamine cyclotransferase